MQFFGVTEIAISRAVAGAGLCRTLEIIWEDHHKG